jgi:hypothetical protein
MKYKFNMKKYVNIVIGLAMTMVFTHCHRENVESNSHINFNNLQIGQQSKYVSYTSRTPHSESDTAYKATGDTIVLTVIAKDENGYKVSEEWLNKKVKTVYYYFQTTGDSLFVKPQTGETLVFSALFPHKHLSYTLIDNNLPKWTLSRWGVMNQQGVIKGFGKIDSINILNQKFDSVLSFYDSDAIVWDGPAFTQLYTKSTGFISFQFIGYFRPYGTLYYLIP